jgi:hypothetical protein
MRLDPFTEFLLSAGFDDTKPFTQKAGGATPGSYFSLKRLSQLLENPLLSPDWVQVTLSGRSIDFENDFLWKTVQKKRLCFIDKQNMDEAIARGASIVLEGIDILDSRIHKLAAEIDEQLPCALVNCEAFFSQKSNEAYSGHRDSDDVLVMQVEGSKRWRIHEPQQRRYLGNSPLTDEQMGPLLTELTMKPGDILFVRAGVPHRCITETDYSLHLSFDLCDRTPNVEQITHAANQLYSECLAPMHTPAIEVVDHYISQLKSARFSEQLMAANKDMKNQIMKFRNRMGRAQRIESLRKFLDDSAT